MRTVSLACLLTICAGAGAQELTIADLAPEETFLVVGVDNASTSLGSFKKTGMYHYFTDPEVKSWIHEMFGDQLDELDDFLSTIDADMDDFAEPTGMLGGAVWMVMPDPDAEGNDALPVHMLFGADFGDNAAQTHDMIVRAIENGEDEEQLTYELEKLGDAEIYTITPTEDEQEDDWDDDWDNEDDWGDEDFGVAGFVPPTPTDIFYAHSGEMLLLSTSLGDLENALSRIEGVNFDSCAETNAYNRLKPAGDEYDAYAVLINQPLYDMADQAEQNMGEDEYSQTPAIMPILDAAGISEVRGASMTFAFDAPEGDTVTEFFVSAPRLRGIMSLINVPDKPFTVPSFVSADAASVMMLQADVANLIPTLMQITNDLPPEMAQAGGMIQMMAGPIQPMLSQLGPEIYVVQSFQRPFSVDSQQMLTAIKAKDAAALNDAVAGMAPMMGLEGRDFQGNQIWSMPEGGGGMVPVGDVSMGIGFGYMFVGPTASVETAMRQADGDDSGLASSEGFKTAMKSLSNNGLAFTYENLDESLAYKQWTLDNLDKIVAARVEEMFGEWADEDMKAQMREEMMGGPMAMMNPPSLKKMLEYVGDTVMEVQLVEGGIKGKAILHRAGD